MLRVKYWVLFCISFPVIAWQGWRLRRHAPRFPSASGDKPGKVIGRRDEGVDQSNILLLGLGDSIIAGVGAETTDQTLTAHLAKELAQLTQRSVEWRIAGWSGATAAEITQNWQSQSSSHSLDSNQKQFVLISVGVNNVTALHSTRRWREELIDLLSTVRDRYPQIQIILLGLPDFSCFPLLPRPLRHLLAVRRAVFDGIAKEYAEAQSDILFIENDLNPSPTDFADDGYHPSAESYVLWARHIVTVLDTTLSLAPKRTPSKEEGVL